MSVKGTHFTARMIRLSAAFRANSDPGRERLLRLAFNRLADHIYVPITKGCKR